MEQTSTFIWIFSGIWGFIGLVFFIIGFVMLRHKKKKELHCTARTYGRVTDIVSRQSHSSDGGYSTSWHPVFEYTIGSLTFVKEYSYGSSRPKFAIGQTVEVFYNPADPHEYYIGGDTLPKKFAVIFTSVGLGAITIAVVSAILIRYLSI